LALAQDNFNHGVEIKGIQDSLAILIPRFLFCKNFFINNQGKF